MQLHAEARALARDRIDMGAPSFNTLTPQQAREGQRAARLAAKLPAPAVGEVADLTTEAGLELRLYRPDAGRAAGVLPALTFFHGGGWTIGDLESHDHLCRSLTRASGAAIVSVDYRLAPETPFPAAVEDAFAAVRWVAENSVSLDIDPNRHGVGGESAGGNLSAVCAQAARDGDLPVLAFQLLLYPCTDLRMGYSSFEESIPGLPVDGPAMRWFIAHYLSDKSHAEDRRASPLLGDLAGVAPAYVLTLGHDPCREEGLAYAEALRAAGVTVTADHLADQFHGLLTLGATMPSVPAHIETLGERIARGLGQHPAST